MHWGDIPDWLFPTARTIMEVVKVNNEDVFWHCNRVGINASFLAKAAGLNEFEQKMAEFAGLFHDIGKVGVPEAILNKPAKLTDEEFDIMKSHPEKSVKALEPLKDDPFIKLIIPAILHHHARIDGRGYPHALKGDEIPLLSRVILVVDTFDAMANDRPYRKGLPTEVIYEELRRYSGQQFDDQLVKIFLEAHRFVKKTAPTEQVSAIYKVG